MFVSALCVAARADTIYLKNGQKITVLKAVESGDHVTGETAVGEISLLKSSVERIEYGRRGIGFFGAKIGSGRAGNCAACGRRAGRRRGFNGGFARRSRWAG